MVLNIKNCRKRRKIRVDEAKISYLKITLRRQKCFSLFTTLAVLFSKLDFLSRLTYDILTLDISCIIMREKGLYCMSHRVTRSLPKSLKSVHDRVSFSACCFKAPGHRIIWCTGAYRRQPESNASRAQDHPGGR